MPAMPRPSKKAFKIAAKILNLPSLQEEKPSKKSKRLQKMQTRLVR